MKNTTKRVLSAVLAIFMLMSVLSVSAFAAEDIVITAQPQDVTGEFGGEVTFSVTATGENLRYQWYLQEGYAVSQLDDEFYPVEGATTATLKVKELTCWLNDAEFFCEVSNDDDYADSDRATVTVPHAEDGVFYYDAETHMWQCDGCGKFINEAAHTFGTDQVCDDCGYDQENPAPMLPVILEFPDWQGVYAGDDVTFSVEAYGIGLTYQWYKRSFEEGSERVKVTDGEKVSGATTANLVLKDVTCDMTMYEYICVVTNAAGETEASGSLNVWHTVAEITYDAFQHHDVCLCGETNFSDYHYDGDCDGKCDYCDYAFAANAPKITVQPEDVELVNGEDATFTVTATGDGLTYQWYSWGDPLMDGERYTGATTATLKVHSIYDPENEIYDCIDAPVGYYCIITNADGAISTIAAMYDIEHADVSDIRSWDNEYTHESYCICGSWIEDTLHVDADKDGQCDLCPDPMFELFNDVTNPESWFYEAAVYGKSAEIFLGDDEGKFNPNNPITRGEIVTVLARIGFTEEYISEMTDEEFEEFLVELADDYGTAPVEFTDVEGAFYERHVRIMAALGVVNGYEGNVFLGNNAINRVELATMLSRFIEVVVGDLPGFSLEDPIDAFNDADKIPVWAEETVEYVREIGLFLGDDYGNFNPYNGATRAETAQTLMRIGFPSGMLING